MTRARLASDVATDVWSTMADLVVNNERKREVCEQTGLSFAKARALRRIAAHPLCMGELATVLAMDPPNITAIIDDLQHSGLVRRQAHPTDRRMMHVVITAEGAKVAKLADDILSEPPHCLLKLPAGDLEELGRILSQLH